MGSVIKMKKQLFHLFLLSLILQCHAEPVVVIAIVAGAIAGLGGLGGVVWWWTKENCNSPYWLTNDLTQFRSDFETFVYGQDFIKTPLIQALETHVKKKQVPQKPLVLSFHGGPGTGKNYVTNFIVKSLYKKGANSDFYRIEVASSKYNNPDKLDQYKSELVNKMKRAVKMCSQVLFVFDDVHLMPEGLLDVTLPYINNFEKVDGLDFRRSIFIFLSNEGASEIEKIAILNREEDEPRERIDYNQIRQMLENEAYKTFKGKRLIDRYFPFLPLNETHVKGCIYHYVETNYPKVPRIKVANHMKAILKRIHFFPDIKPNWFSRNGCRDIIDPIEQELYDEIVKTEL